MEQAEFQRLQEAQAAHAAELRAAIQSEQAVAAEARAGQAVEHNRLVQEAQAEMRAGQAVEHNRLVQEAQATHAAELTAVMQTEQAVAARVARLTPCMHAPRSGQT